MQRKAALVVVLVASLAPATARAQFSAYYLPVERGYVDSHVDLQLHYSRLTEELCVLGTCDELVINAAILSVEAQYAILDRFEVGVNVPFVVHAWANLGSSSDDDTNFGDILLNLKAKIVGFDWLSVAAFVNTSLPTHSGEGDRDTSMMQLGGAVTSRFLGVLLGANLQGLWAINGDGDDAALLGMDFYGGYKLFGMLSLTLAFQYFHQIHPDTQGTLTPFAITPGVELNPLRGLRVGIASRIAANDDARLMFIGRASVLFHAGYTF